MTKRTAEQTLRDEIARAEREYAASQVRRDAVIAHVAEAQKLLEESERLVRSARQKILRSEAALDALIEPTPILEEVASIDDWFEPGEGPAPVDATDPETVFPPDRAETIAAATGVDVETVRAAAKH